MLLVTFSGGPEPEREREKYYTFPALWLTQVLPRHPLAEPKT